MAETPGPPSFESPNPFSPRRPEGGESQNEYGKLLFERAGNYPVPGPDIIEDLQLVEIGEGGDTSELEEVVKKALAYREGLVVGPTGEAYIFDTETLSSKDPANEKKRQATIQKLATIQNLFTTVESSTNRPRAEYVEVALEEAIDGRIRRAQAWRNDPEAYRRRIEKKIERLERIRGQEGQASLSQEQKEGLIAEDVARLSREYAAIPKLIEIKNHSHSRKIFDAAFIHRMYSCEDPGRAAKLGSSDFPTYTPDGGHWLALFRGENGEFGRKVNEVFEEMVKFALPHDENDPGKDMIKRLGLTPIPADVRKQVPVSVYATGFENATMFAYWMNHLLKRADGRMDIVWNAWKLMLTWEVADNLGEAVNRKKEWTLSVPPIGSSLHNFLSHFDIKRRIEFGLDASGGMAGRTQVEKFVSHSGLPMSIGKIPNLCENYFKESKLKFDKSYASQEWIRQAVINLSGKLPKKGDFDYERADKRRKQYLERLRNVINEWSAGQTNGLIEVSLWDLWLYGRVGFADEGFPWFATDQADASAEAGELPPGSVGGWFLRRSRCWGEKGGVVNDIRSIPSIRELGDPLFFVSRLRNWAKVLKVENDTLPEENPRAWWVAGILWYHRGGTARTLEILRREPQREFRTLARSEEIEEIRVAGETRSVGLGDVLHNAVQCGFLRSQDADWIKKTLGLKTP